jgi:SAM-dependent methyltransferase
MVAKHPQWGERYSSIFKDPSVAAAYRFRPEYPPEVFDTLAGLIADGDPRVVLDAGCGTGFIARGLVRRVERVDAVDFSRAMIDAGCALPGGDAPGLHWTCAPIEEADLSPPYGLVVAGDAIHWMDWERALPRFHEVGTPGARLAIAGVNPRAGAWTRELLPIISEYSMNPDFVPYDLDSVCTDLAARGLFRPEGQHETAAVRWRQPVSDYVESIHARNGFSRDRMEPQAAAECDRLLGDVVRRHCPDGSVELLVSARVVWGRPAPPRPDQEPDS